MINTLNKKLSRHDENTPVIPAEAGIHPKNGIVPPLEMDPRLRGDDRIKNHALIIGSKLGIPNHAC